MMQISDPPGEALRTVTLSIVPVRPAAERYEIGEELGRGGMAVVHAATDRANGRKLALKRLLVQGEAPKQRRSAELFEREYLALAQLTHPCIVTVHDYGIDLEGAYYTMELVDGADLQQLSPLPWRQAVALARDCCSALAFLHSRRLVHRDISPRNLRKTASGRGKLLDFGALAPFGLSKLIVGTPPCCAPEVLQLQALDGRADIYALGTVLYYTLVGQHAYAARNFSMLSQLWQSPPVPPSQLVPDVPAELDALVLDLLRLDPDARPASAAEVLQRLSAIDGESPSDEAYAAQAYLATPPLVGREDALARARRKIKRSMYGNPHALVVDGVSGVGRSRLLGACLLEATLLGVCVARADADDALHGEYGALRALVRQLAAAMPQQAAAAAAPHGAVLTQVFPELGAQAEPLPEPSAPPETHALQNAVREWFTSMSEHGPLLIAVDDFHRIDEPSAALLTLLATQGKRALCLIATMVSGADTAANPAQKLLLECASRLPLEPLALSHTESLLKSLFGDVSNIAGLARRLQEVTAGNPRDLLRLAGHLVEGGQARYEAGAWTLPARIDQIELPGSMEQALRSTLGSLPSGSLTLATGLALCADRLFSLEECALLQSSGDMVSLRRDLDCLLQAEVVRATEDRFGLALPAWGSLLADSRSPALTRLLHARLAAILEQRGETFRAGQHWLRAGDADRGLNVLVAHARTSQEETARDNSIFIRYARSLPADWLETFDEAIGWCERLGRPKRDAFILRGRLIGIIAAFGASDLGHMEQLLRQLKHDSGLDDFESLDASLEPRVRVKLALERAAARFAAAPEEQRVFEPKHAMTVLSRAISVATGRVRSGLDVTYLRDLPSIAPLAPVMPAFAVLDLLREGMEARFTGRIERAHELYQRLLRTLSEPGHGLELSYAQSMYATVMSASGQLEAYMGLGSCLELAARIEEQPTRRSGAVQLRALYHLFQGNARESDDCKKQLELLRVESMQLYEGSSLVFEITAHSIVDDMTRMRHVVEELRPLAEKYPAWRAVAHFGAAEYQRMRKADERAAAEIALGLQLAQPGVHPIWSNLAAAHVRSVVKLESAQAALGLARAYSAKAHALELGCSAEVLHAELAICEALTGCETAERSADAVIERLTARGIGGLLLGLAYETRAHVALLRKNPADCDVFMQRCEQIYLQHKNAALRTKCERLRRMVNPASNRGAPAGVGALDTTLTGTRVVAALESCQAEQRGRLTLTLLAGASGSRAGFLFTVGSEGLQCTASIGNLPLPPGLMQHVIDYVEAQREYEDDTTQSRSLVSDNVVLEWQDAAGRRYRPVLLSHAVQDNLRVVGVAVLEVPQGQPFKYPADTATAVSRFWVDSASSLLISGD